MRYCLSFYTFLPNLTGVTCLELDEVRTAIRKRIRLRGVNLKKLGRRKDSF